MTDISNATIPASALPVSAVPAPTSTPAVVEQPTTALEFDSGARSDEMQAVAPPVDGQGGIRGTVIAVKEKASRLIATQKPWAEMIDRSSFSKPENFGEVTNRLQKNLAYYRTNYLVFGLSITALAFLSNPASLIWMALLGLVWFYLFMIKTSPLVINGREISDREKMMGMSVASFVVIFFLTNVAAIFLYGASLAAAMIAAHASFREPDQLFVDEGVTSEQINLFGNVNFLAGAQAYTQPQAGTNMV
jgi:PRA1 family protein 1